MGPKKQKISWPSFFFRSAIEGTKQKLNGALPAEDMEDIALSAVMSFCMRIREGSVRYQGDKQLFSLLRRVIDGKIRKLWQYHFAQKRDIRQVEALHGAPLETALQVPVEDQLSADSVHVTPDEQPAVDRILGDLQSELHGLFTELLSNLDEHPRRLLLVLLESDVSNEELAKRIGRSVASVDRYRQLIRHKIKSLKT